MQNVDKLVVGGKIPRYPAEAEGKCLGTLEVRSGDWIEFNAFLPNLTFREIKAFENEPIKVKYYGNTSNGKNVIYFNTGVGLFENVFNPNLYPDDRMTDFVNGDSVTLFMTLVDSSDMTIKAIRHISVGRRVADNLREIWKAGIQSGITKEEYDNWVNTEIIPVNPALHYSIGRDIGIIRGGFVTEQAVFFGE